MALSVLVDIPVTDPAFQTLVFQVLIESLRKGNTSVFSACAAERHHKLALSLVDIERDKKIQQVFKLFDKSTRLLEA